MNTFYAIGLLMAGAGVMAAVVFAAWDGLHWVIRRNMNVKLDDRLCTDAQLKTMRERGLL